MDTSSEKSADSKFVQPAEDMNEGVNFFEIPALSTAEEGSYLMKLTPVTSIENNINISYEFDVDSQQYADLHNSFHFVTVKISAEDGTNLDLPDPVTDNEKVTFANNIASTIFEDCQLTLNGSLIESGNNLYPYKCYFQNFISAGKDIKDTQLAISGYFREGGDIDSPAVLNTMSSNTCKNRGLNERFKLSSESKPIHLVSPLFLDLAGQKKYLQNNTNVKIKFTRSDNKFALIAKTPQKISNFQLWRHIF